MSSLTCFPALAGLPPPIPKEINNVLAKPVSDQYYLYANNLEGQAARAM
jgi:hypothetical protein